MSKPHVLNPTDRPYDEKVLAHRNVDHPQFKRIASKYDPVIELMVYGYDKTVTISDPKVFGPSQIPLPAGEPFTIEQAARFLKLGVKTARRAIATNALASKLNEALFARRSSERPRILQTQIQIRDYEGDRSPARDTVRLKACDAIEGKSSSGTSVNVNVNQSTNLTAGYVIKLPAAQPLDKPTIEHQSKP